eukprot:1161618-Pelagomonas_calceolata.AAC.5
MGRCPGAIRGGSSPSKEIQNNLQHGLGSDAAAQNPNARSMMVTVPCIYPGITPVSAADPTDDSHRACGKYRRVQGQWVLR